MAIPKIRALGNIKLPMIILNVLYVIKAITNNDRYLCVIIYVCLLSPDRLLKPIASYQIRRRHNLDAEDVNPRALY